MKRFLVLGLVSLLMVAIGWTQDKVELKKIEVPSSLMMHVDLIEVYKGKKAGDNEWIMIMNEEAPSGIVTKISVWAALEEIIGPYSKPVEIVNTVIQHGDIGIAISLEKEQDLDSGRNVVFLGYESGYKEVIYFDSDSQSIKVVPLDTYLSR